MNIAFTHIISAGSVSSLYLMFGFDVAWWEGSTASPIVKTAPIQLQPVTAKGCQDQAKLLHKSDSSIALYHIAWHKTPFLSYRCNRQWRPVGLWDVEAPTLARLSAHRWRWGCQPYAPVALYPEKVTWLSFLLQAESTPGVIVRLEELGPWKNAMNSSGMEPATFRLVA
jgi:hypothetical protein